MGDLHNITSENFNESFNLNNLLQNSAFYPASGTDGTHLKELTHTGINSFVHVDYLVVKEKVKRSLENDFIGQGYKLVGIKDISFDKVIPNGFISHADIPLNSHERKRIQELKHVSDRFYQKEFSQFALWAVYELDPMATVDISRKMKKFSILHIGSEACSTFDALYLSNGINPAAVIMLNPGEGYGDNWTLFTNPKFRLYKMFEKNVNNNAQIMPKYLLTNGNQVKADNACWSGYVSEYVKYSYCITTDELEKQSVRHRWIELFSLNN